MIRMPTINSTNSRARARLGLTYPHKVRRKLIVKLFASRLKLEGLTEGELRVVADLRMKMMGANAA